MYQKKMNPTDIKLRHVVVAAATFLDTYHPTRSLPVPIEQIAEIDLDLVIEPIPNIKTLLGVDAFITADFLRVIVDDHSYTAFLERTRFSIAHELGHLLLHKEWYSHFGPKNLDEALTFQEKLDSKEYQYMETQANTFAGLVLVPTNVLTNEMRKLSGGTKYPIALTLPIITDLAERFCVSSETLVIRLIKEGIVPDPRKPF
jgi:hypothetical protein